MQGTTRFTAGSSNSSSSNGGVNSSSSKTATRSLCEEDRTAVRKGPWMAEEDEILLEYVRKHGPRDWSSIRSKGLLPRTGKSCRLRWVNKLKPDLKTGCKFSPEEERIVIDLQAQFGNKWARIATYMPGRTDNDVKNFWSTRQKRLARILCTPLPPKSNNIIKQDKGKLLPPSTSREASSSEDPCLDLILFEDDSSKGQCSSNVYATEVARMPDLVSCPCGMLNLDVDSALPLRAPPPGMVVDGEQQRCSNFLRNPAMPPPPQLPFDHLLPQPLSGLPLLDPEATTCAGLHGGGIRFPIELAGEPSRCCIQLDEEELPFFGLEDGSLIHGIKREDVEHPAVLDDGFFDDFPADMFDCPAPERPPLPPSSSTKSS